MLPSFNVYSWLIHYTQNVETIKFRISQEIIMYNIQLKSKEAP